MIDVDYAAKVREKLAAARFDAPETTHIVEWVPIAEARIWLASEHVALANAFLGAVEENAKLRRELGAREGGP